MATFSASFWLAIATLFVILPPNTFGKAPCPSFCRFRLCHFTFRDGLGIEKENRGLLLGVPFSPLGYFVCKERRNRNKVRQLFHVTGGEARVSKKFKDDFIPISEFMNSEVSPSFKKDYLRWQANDRNESSIARARPQGNQDQVLDRMCVQMPIKSYRSQSGRLVRPESEKACVGFLAVLPKMLVDFEWDSPDDFDLTLEEPNGDLINRFEDSRSSRNGGRLIRDKLAGVCTAPFGNERIRYNQEDVVDKGRYIIRVDHNRLCASTIKFKLRVLYNGHIILDERRFITRNGTGDDAVVRTFMIDDN